MNKKKFLVISLIMTIILALSLTTASLAWFSLTSKAVKSLDYVTISESIVTFELSKAELSSRVYPAKAVKGAVALGKPFESVFKEGGDSNIETKATIGVSKLNLAYYGNEGSSSTMKINCSVSSTLLTGENIDLSRDIYYIICAQGTGLTIDDRFKIDPEKIPNTEYWQEEEGTENYVPYVMGINDGYYIMNTNVSHQDLLTDFGVNNYKSICKYNETTNTCSSFIDDNYKNDSGFALKVESSVKSKLKSFNYNEINYYIETEGTDTYGIYVEETVGTIATSKEMNLDFLILIWYNKVDELLDPSESLGEVNISVRVDIE